MNIISHFSSRNCYTQVQRYNHTGPRSSSRILSEKCTAPTHGSSLLAIPVGGSTIWRIARPGGTPQMYRDFTDLEMAPTHSLLRGLSSCSTIVNIFIEGNTSGFEKSWNSGGSKKGGTVGNRRRREPTLPEDPQTWTIAQPPSQYAQAGEEREHHAYPKYEVA